MAGLSSSHREEAEGIGIKTVELPLIPEALDDGLSTGETRMGILVG